MRYPSAMDAPLLAVRLAAVAHRRHAARQLPEVTAAVDRSLSRTVISAALAELLGARPFPWTGGVSGRGLPAPRSLPVVPVLVQVPNGSPGVVVLAGTSDDLTSAAVASIILGWDYLSSTRDLPSPRPSRGAVRTSLRARRPPATPRR